MEIRAIVLHEQDNVVVLTQPARAGDTVSVYDASISILEDAPTGHKVAVRPIGAGTGIVKYGVVIGEASRDIAAGEWVHTHNVVDITEQICNAYAAQYRAKAKEECGYGHDIGI